MFTYILMVTSKSDKNNIIDVLWYNKIEAYKIIIALSVSAHGKIYTES